MTVRRLKTYASSQGFAYQYYFVGKRAAIGDAAGTEYVFDVTSDRKLTYPVRIFVPNAAVQAWADAHLRSLSDSEQYAAVKLRLFRAFDEACDMQAEGRELQVDAPFLEESLASLGVV
ncbi:MAG: hypothetical protein WAU58_19440 [Terriglobales bacterium]|jgi:hypothetical protein